VGKWLVPIKGLIMHSCHSCSSIVHRALVTYTNSSTGEIRVKIPAVTGNNTEISISRIGRQPSNGVWSVPNVGEQIIVSADDSNMTNVFWLRTDQPTVLDTPTITVSTSNPTGGTAGDIWVVV
jgi:phage baseplate assembly protein gpV